MLTIPLTILSAVYMCLLTIVYFSKERITNSENKIYSTMIKLSCLGIILDTLSCILVIYDMTSTLYFRVITILIFMYYIMWSCFFLLYTYVISFKTNNMSDKEFTQKHGNKLKIIFAFFAICALLIPLLPLNYHIENDVIYPIGLSVDLTYFVAAALAMGAMLVMMIINRKNIRTRKYVPVYALIILFLVAVVIQKSNPGLILTTTVECFITFLMYFTVENPDVKMIRELYKNKKLVEKSNEDNSKFLFRITQDIKNPVKQLIHVSNDILKSNDIEYIKQASQYVSNYSNQLDYIVNQSLNISNLNTQKIKIFETRYNVNNFFKEISYRIKNDLTNEVKFNFTISNNIPKLLYGDTIKLKQAINSLLRSSIEHTNQGFINVDVSAMIKYNVCRLMIQIEDSGCGMDIEKVNTILSLEKEDLEKIKVDIADEKQIGLKEVKKLIQILGGSFFIKSEINQGTTFIIVLDQKIVETEENEITKRLENYEQTLYRNKKYLVIDDDEQELAKITEMLEEKDIFVNSSIFERDCIEKVNSKNKYDLIILDDEMPNYSAIAILQELQKIKNFKTPVVIMINDNKESIKLHYLKDGFADCIMKSKLESEIQRITKRF